MVVRSDSDVSDITGSQTFLAGRGLGEFERPDAQELVLELVHPGRCEQNSRIILWNQYVTWPTYAAFGFEESQIFFTQFVSFHIVRSSGILASQKPWCSVNVRSLGFGKGVRNQ